MPIPTPTIDPVLYDAAYAAAEQARYDYQMDKFIVDLLLLAAVGVVYLWLKWQEHKTRNWW